MISVLLLASYWATTHNPVLFRQKGELIEILQVSERGDQLEMLFPLKAPVPYRSLQVSSNQRFVAVTFGQRESWDIRVYRRSDGYEVNRLAGTVFSLAVWQTDGSLWVYPSEIVTKKPLPEHERGGPLIAIRSFSTYENPLQPEDLLQAFLSRAFTKHDLVTRAEFSGKPGAGDGRLLGEKYGLIRHREKATGQNIYSLIRQDDLAIVFSLDWQQVGAAMWTDRWVAFFDMQRRLHVFSYAGIKVGELDLSDQPAATSSAASTVFQSRLATVIGPTPPGTGVMAEATAVQDS